ncbi:hypothetical protein MNBD_PLANCTO02-2196 [hydrothermal vent metagenome]|uniref:Transposase IS200-like domain-containing protein n=1 Tax=hydrothermal vent metagenome TaxID=652676 RepID=A0A3B1DX92_9ZZZZ
MTLVPKPKRTIYDDELYAHFITFSCYKHRKFLERNQPKRILLGVLNSQLSKQKAKCIGFVIMPNHVHIIVWFPEPNQLSMFVKQWKQQTSVKIKQFFQENFPDYFSQISEQEPIWQRKYYPFHLYSQEKIEEKLNYMHMNPVKAELVEKSIDWQWSSARYYELGKSVGVPIQWVE